MPYISKCSNKKCPVREKCYRFTSVPSPEWQAYANFKYEVIDGEVKCEWFHPI